MSERQVNQDIMILKYEADEGKLLGASHRRMYSQFSSSGESSTESQLSHAWPTWVQPLIT